MQPLNIQDAATAANYNVSKQIESGNKKIEDPERLIKWLTRHYQTEEGAEQGVSFLERSREAELGTQETHERALEVAEGRRRRRVLLSAHSLDCKCEGTYDLFEDCPRPEPHLRMRKQEFEWVDQTDENGKLIRGKDGCSTFRAPQCIEPDENWRDAYIDRLENTRPINALQWVQMVGGLTRKIEKSVSARFPDFTVDTIEQIRNKFARIFRRQFGLYGQAFWNNSILRDQIARELEMALMRKYDEMRAPAW